MARGGSTGNFRHLYTTADRSSGGGVSLDAAALMTSPRMTSSSHRPRRQHQPAFVETDFTVPLTVLESSNPYHPRVGVGTDYYVIASRDAARPAHTGSSPAPRRLDGFGTPTMSRTSNILSPVSRPLIGSYGQSVYPQRRDIHHGSPLSPQTTTAFVLLPSSAGLSRSHSSRQLAGNTAGFPRASSTLHSPPGSHHHYRTIQPKPSATSMRYLAGPVSVQPSGMVLQPSRVTSERRTSLPDFVGGGTISWRGDSAPVLNVPRLPAAAHGSRPLPAAHASSGGPSRGTSSGRGSLPSLGVGAALSLTIDDQAPLDCSRKSSGDNVELDVPTVLNLTTSGQGGVSTDATSGSSTSPEHVDAVASLASPRLNSTVERHQLSKLEQTYPAAGPTASDVTQAGGQHDIEMTLNDLEEIKPSPADLASSEDRPSMTSLDLGDEQAGQRVKADIINMTLNDLEAVKVVPVSSAPSDLKAAADLHDIEMTSIDLENIQFEQRLETNADDILKDTPSPPYEEDTSATRPVMTLPSDGVGCVDEEREFLWDDYLNDTKSVAVPATSFKHVECSLQSGFVKGMLVHVANRSPLNTYWPASIVMPCGQLLRLRPVGCDDAARDFWCDVTSADVRPISSCHDRQPNICPPDDLAVKLADWHSLLKNSLEGATTPPSYMLDRGTGTLPIDQIKEGMFLEAQHDVEPDLVWPVKVIENVGGRLLLRYEAAETAAGDFWLFYLHHRLHPIGWARSHDCTYRPPSVVVSGSELTDSDWDQRLRTCLAEAENFQPPSEIFADQTAIIEHRFQEGWKLEAVDQSLPSVIRPATVVRVINKLYFIVELDDLTMTSEDRRPGNQLCCHAGSLNIFPVGWCSANNIHLTPVPSWKADMFDWQEYLSYCSAEAAPADAFITGPVDHEFEGGMKLEAVNPQQPGQICVATITGVFDNRLLKFRIDHQMAAPSFYYTIDSHDMFPIGWCESNQYQLKTPVMRSLPAVDKSASRKVAVVQPDGHLGDDPRTVLYQQLKEADGRSSSWCPKIYFNYRCFTGPYLSKGRLMLLPQSVGPGPVTLVVREVLTMLINVAYKSSRVLRELQQDAEPNPEMQQQVLGAKYKGKSYSAKVEICRTGDQVEEFCRRVCVKLECCPNLVSPHCLSAGVQCPDNCGHLSKTKFTNYEKKRRKVGRPPGGHSNLELAAKRPGRRKRHRRIVLTLRKKHGVPASASCDVIDDVGDYEIDSHSTGSGSEQLMRSDAAATGDLRTAAMKSAGVGNPRRRKRRFDSLPARDMQTRGAKMQRYRFEKRTHQKVLHVAPFEPDAELQCEVSPCQIFSNEAVLKLDTNPLHWSVRDVIDFIKTTDCASLARVIYDQEIDGQSLMLLSLPTIQEHLELKLGPAVKLCHQIERVKIAFFEQFANDAQTR